MTILKEAGTLAKSGTGRFKIGVITPGTGSSGTYPRETIEAAGRDKVFAAGTHMYLDHATEAQSWERPEGSIKDLVGVLTEDAYWDDSAGGLVAEARIYSTWKTVLEEMKDDIGISIRASGEVEEASGQRIVTKLTEARSVDFVTKAGRGGKIMEILESAREQQVQESVLDETWQLLRKAVRAARPEEWLYVRDHNDSTVWYDVETEAGDSTCEQSYTRDGITVTLTGTPTEVFPTTVYVPTNTTSAPAGEEVNTSDNQEESIMGDTTNAETSRVEEADSELEKLKKENAALKAEIAELKKQSAKEARRTEVAGIVEEAFANIDAPTTKSDLVEKFTESDTSSDSILSEAKTRAEEILGVTGNVRGLGESAPAAGSNVQESGKTYTDEDVVNVLKGA